MSSSGEVMVSGGLKRRDFLKLVGVGGAGLALGCARKPEKIVPYAVQPDEIIPGIPVFYASACKGCATGCGLIVRTREGRAIKLEGNPDHPVNRGGLCARGHAEMQELYNPDRLPAPVRKQGAGWQKVTWDEALATLAEKARGAGANAAVLTGHETGTLDRLIDEWLKAGGATRHLRYEAFGFEPLREATRLAFGRNVVPSFDFSKARVVLSLGADFLETGPASLSASRGMADARAGKSDGQRFIAFDSRQGLTASNADQFISIKPGSEMAVALGLLHIIQSEGLAGGNMLALPSGYDPAGVEAQSGVKADVLRQVAREFAQARPGLAVTGGIAAQGDNATALCLAVHLLNSAVGNVGQTLNLDAPLRLEGLASLRDMKTLIDDMNGGRVGLLVIDGPNPAFTLPASMGFEAALAKVPFKVSLARQLDETSELCDLILPASHSLESWDDSEPVAGVHNLIQPSMRPVFGTLSAGEIFFNSGKRMGMALKQADYLGYLEDAWKSRHGGGGDWQGFWDRTVQAGGIFAPAAATAQRASGAAIGAARFAPPTLTGDAADPVLLLAPSANLYDGRGANKPWMQEIPDPVTKVMWESWIEISPAMARKLGVAHSDLLELHGLEQRLVAPAYIQDGIRDDAVAVSVGRGHTSYGRYAKGHGINPFRALRPVMDAASGAPAYLQARVKVSKAGGQLKLPTTIPVAHEGRTDMGRGIVQTITVEQLLHPQPSPPSEGDDRVQPYVPRYKREYAKHPLSGDPMQNKHRWQMAIDLDRCNGCGACVAACYSENNIQWVGKNETWKNRNMSWIRIERYEYPRGDGTVDFRHIPMTCQQCDNAPCEYVCPVYATYHNPEGISAQIYNRCIGTRYCSNNCPYRVRRFNYQEPEMPTPLNWGLNPEVTLRNKGVMEKCSFCIQRIVAARNDAKDEGRDIRDGEVVTACASSCPTQAITFGDVNNPDSRISRIAKDPRGYRVLDVLNTQPNIHYLKRVRREAEKA